MINLTIDGQSVTVAKGTTVYQAAKQMGITLPIFCYQDRMPPFGACRVCLVEVEKMGKLQTSCTLEATEGMVVRTQSDPAVKGRKDILEFLLVNHPLDCPICDKGGECPLQEQALSDGPGESRFVEEKRHFTKALPLGPVLMLDRERCIVCARCTRFGDIVAGDHALEFIDRGFKSEVGTPSGEPVESKFIGNTIKICPVGALTSQVYRFRARPWDNLSTPSTCTLCPVGCSLVLDSRDGEIMRTRSQENPAVNDIWLCDKGWFGYEFTSSPARLKKPLVRKGDKLVETSWEEAIELIAAKMKTFKPAGKLAGWGGNPLTVEESFAFQKLFREGMGVNHLDHRLGEPLFSLADEGLPPGMEIAIGECEKLSFGALLGLDLTEEFPVIWLRLKQAINLGAKIQFAGHFAPEMAQHLEKTTLHAPGHELETLKKVLPQLAETASKGGLGAIFVGRQYLASPQRSEILAELSKFKEQNPAISLNIMEGRGNSLGARFAGMHPDLGPFAEPLTHPGLSCLQVLQAAANTGWDFLWVAGSDPAQKFPAPLWHASREKLSFLVVQDLFLTDTAKQADLVLPTLSYIEKGGSFINLAGHIQKLLPGKEVPEAILSDGEIFSRVAEKLELNPLVDPLFLDELKREKILFDNRGFKTAKTIPVTQGALKATFAPALFDQGVRMLHNAHLTKVAKKPTARLHPDEAAKRGLSDGATVRVTSQDASLTTPITLDKTVAPGTLVLPLGFEELPVHNLAPNLLNGLVIEIETL